MGRSYKFRLSNMMPNAWFCKLKDLGNKQGKGGTLPSHYSTSNKLTRISTSPPKQFPSPSPPPPTPSTSLEKQQFPASLRPGRASYYIPSGEQDRLLCSLANQPTKVAVILDPPRKSKKKSRRTSPKQQPLPLQTKDGVAPSALDGTLWTALAEVLPAECQMSAIDGPVTAYDAYGMECYYDPGPSPQKLTDSTDYHRVMSRRDTDFAVDFGSNSHSPSTTTVMTTSTTTTTASTVEAEAGDVDLRPILTKPAAKKDRTSVPDLDSPVKLLLKNQINNLKKGSGPRGRRSPPSSSTPGVTIRTRVNSPRLAAASRKAAGLQRARLSNSGTATATTLKKGSTGRLSGSLAVVKSSADPRKDFRESMLEMIEENKLWGSKDLEELLACYLSLNSSEYQDVIIKVFQQIWFDLTNLNNNCQDRID